MDYYAILLVHGSQIEHFHKAFMKEFKKTDGFLSQIMFVVPPPVLEETTRHILVSSLYPTDIGWFPRARHHARRRVDGAEQNILIFCTRGSGWFEINGKRHTLKANQALLLPANTPHQYGASLRDPWTIHWVHFLGEDAAYFFTLLKPGGHIVPVDTALTPKLDRLFADAYEAFADGFTQQSIICASQAIRHILGLLFFNNRAFHPRTKAASFACLDLTIELMRRHVDSPLTVEKMARQAGISVTHFSRLFSLQTGFSPMEYFIRMKMQRACRYLTLTPLSIKELASRIGYDDPYYFSRSFRKIMGVPPTVYRQSIRG